MHSTAPRTYRSSWSCETDVDTEYRPLLRKTSEDSKNNRRRVMSVCSEVERLTYSCMEEIASLQISEVDVRKIVDEVVKNLCSTENIHELNRLRYDSDTSSGYSCSHAGSMSSSIRKRLSICSSRVSICSNETLHQQNCCLHGQKFPVSPSLSPTNQKYQRRLLYDYQSFRDPSFINDKFPQFDCDSLDSSMSTDSLNDLSIISRDSLNSMSELDSLEYSPTVCSVDSLDSFCEFDSLSDGKDSGFFSCSLPVC